MMMTVSFERHGRLYLDPSGCSPLIGDKVLVPTGSGPVRHCRCERFGRLGTYTLARRPSAYAALNSALMPAWLKRNTESALEGQLDTDVVYAYFSAEPRLKVLTKSPASTRGSEWAQRVCG